MSSEAKSLRVTSSETEAYVASSFPHDTMRPLPSLPGPNHLNTPNTPRRRSYTQDAVMIASSSQPRQHWGKVPQPFSSTSEGQEMPETGETRNTVKNRRRVSYYEPQHKQMEPKRVPMSFLFQPMLQSMPTRATKISSSAKHDEDLHAGRPSSKFMNSRIQETDHAPQMHLDDGPPTDRLPKPAVSRFRIPTRRQTLAGNMTRDGHAAPVVRRASLSSHRSMTEWKSILEGMVFEVSGPSVSAKQRQSSLIPEMSATVADVDYSRSIIGPRPIPKRSDLTGKDMTMSNQVPSTSVVFMEPTDRFETSRVEGKDLSIANQGQSTSPLLDCTNIMPIDCFFEQLPTELMTDIFLLVVALPAHRWKPFDIPKRHPFLSEVTGVCRSWVEQPLLLSAVNRRWRNIALSTVLLWSRLIVRTGRHNYKLEVEMVQQWLKRVGRLRFDLHIIRHGSASPELVNVLLPCMYRCRVVYLGKDPGATGFIRPDNLLDSFAQRTHHTWELDIEDEIYEGVRMDLRGCTNLQAISCHNDDFFKRASFSEAQLSSLQFVKMVGRLEDAYTVLERFSNLVELSISVNGSNLSWDRITRIVRPNLQLLDLHLSDSGTPTDFWVLWERLTLPSLRALNTDVFAWSLGHDEAIVAWSTLEDFLRRSKAPLRYLYLRVGIELHEDKVLGLLTAVPDVKDLKLLLHGSVVSSTFWRSLTKEPHKDDNGDKTVPLCRNLRGLYIQVRSPQPTDSSQALALYAMIRSRSPTRPAKRHLSGWDTGTSLRTLRHLHVCLFPVRNDQGSKNMFELPEGLHWQDTGLTVTSGHTGNYITSLPIP